MSLKERLEKLNKLLNIEQKKAQITQIEGEMNEPDFWLDDKSSGAKIRELKDLKEEVDKFTELHELSEMAEEDDLSGLESEVAELEKLTKFKSKYDQNGVILSFFAGAGGDDAQDWTEMLLKMYLKWAQNEGLKATILDEAKGSIAGIKGATLELEGRYAYGKLKGEAGVHRLVRQSPFNAKSLRQTSFSLVEVMPKIEQNDKDFEIKESDLRIDTFRASGHGGQSVNTTDSAVRITHIPTNLVVSCQNEKSQLQNKLSAMSVLKSRLAKLLEDQHKEKIDELKGESREPEWGSQIRSYVLHPYKQVKDHRTGVVSKNPDAVLNGELSEFIEAELQRSMK